MAAAFRFALLLALVLGASFAPTPARPQPAGSDESDAYAWLQYGADGRPHLRVIPSDRGSCPAATADGRGVALTVSVVAAGGFDRVLCDAALPATASVVEAAGRQLPLLPHRIARFVVLGDTGCRIQGPKIQNCRDAAAWPFARIARSIAADTPRPDLIVHVGDYQYRESACPAGDPRCAGSPYGDTWDAWAVDFFEPGAPLFATAPIIWVRGNHEACARAGLGWSRYLAPAPDDGCRDHDDPAVAAFDDLMFVNVDSAVGDETSAEPAAFERDERIANADGNGKETFVLTHRPPLAYLAAHAAADPNGNGIAAIIAGHVHLFAALSFPGAPPALIIGTGGDTLETDLRKATFADPGGTAEARFGYAVFDRVPGGWSISERDPDGSEHRRCELRARTVHC